MGSEFTADRPGPKVGGVPTPQNVYGITTSVAHRLVRPTIVPLSGGARKRPVRLQRLVRRCYAHTRGSACRLAIRRSEGVNRKRLQMEDDLSLILGPSVPPSAIA
jgi:hypothetical protein